MRKYQQKNISTPIAVLLTILVLAFSLSFILSVNADTESPQNKPEGINGKSAYELAVEEGFEGSISEWLDSLKGESAVLELPTSEVPALRELYLEGVDENRKLYLRQFRKDYLNANKQEYITSIYISYADAPDVTIAKFQINSTEKANYTGEKIIRLESVYSTVSGYAFVDYDKATDGMSFYKGAVLDTYDATHLVSSPNIQQYLLSLGSYDGIVRLNKDMESFVFNASKSRSNLYDHIYSPLEFVHFSDIHGQVTEWKRIVEYIDHYDDYIDFGLHTGDICGSSLESSKELYRVEKPKNVPILNAVGNHDTYMSDDAMNTNGVTQDMIKDVVLEDIDGWDVTFGTEENAMYYYKDFPDQGIRLIVLNDQNYTDAQAAWLTETLNSAKNAGLAVVTASHMVTAPVTEFLNCSFTPVDNYSSVAYVPTQAFEAQLVSFKESGGTHIIHLCGHCHYDNIGYTKAGILNMSVECATHYDAHTESVRVTGTKSFDCFNVVAIDRNTNRLKVIRIGNNTNASMKEKTVFCYDYVQKEMIACE